MGQTAYVQVDVLHGPAAGLSKAVKHLQSFDRDFPETLPGGWNKPPDDEKPAPVWTGFTASRRS